MSFLSNIRAAVSQFRSGIAQSEPIHKDFNTKGIDRRDVIKSLNRIHQYRFRLELDNWRNATDLALSPIQPRRYELYRMYHEIKYDLELLTQLRDATIEVQAAPFEILRGGSVNKKARKYFEKTWFREFLKLALYCEFEGYQVLYFKDRADDGTFKDVQKVPNEHVSPDLRQILINAHDIEGVPVDDLVAQGVRLIELGRPSDLGLLSVAAIAVMRKNYSMTDWSERNEEFGKPYVWLETDVQKPEEIKAREKMLGNFGRNKFGLGQKDVDKITFLESHFVANGHMPYLGMIDYQDKALAKLINGQTATTNEKAWTGSAEVQERTKGKYVLARLAEIQGMINDTLIPFLIKNGYAYLNGSEFQFTELLEKETPTNNDPKNGGNGEDPTQPKPKPTDPKAKQPIQKKNLTANLDALYQPLCCDHEPLTRLESSFNLSDLFDKAIQRIFDGKTKAGDLDADLWRYNVTEIWKGLDDGFKDVPDSKPSLIQKELKQNSMVFAAFKNHNNVQDMVDLLTDAQGEVRSFADFKKDALLVNQKYNVSWLESEYQLARRSATMAVEWQQIESNSDLFPNIKYITAGDDRVREAHKKLDDIVLPINDPFWNSFFPPNGWGCRCHAQSSDDKVKQPKAIPDEKEVPLMFRNNSGKSGEVFPDTHPYFDVDKKTDKAIRKQAKNLKP
jgi:Phage Mu protein F like protein/Protein of unknown function (DUF935)